MRRLGNLLVFLAAAAPGKMTSTGERHRYATVGMLMLVTAAQAFYSATLFFSISLDKPFRREIGFGAFFAVAVYLIDRSIISYASPVKLDKDNNLRPPKKTSWVLGARVVIAIAAALLMSEMILLQVFAGDIAEQMQADHIATTQRTGSQIESYYQARIAKLQDQITQAQSTVSKQQNVVNALYAALKCQEFGCPGVKAGIGPGFRAAQANYNSALQTLDTDKGQLQTIRATNRPVISRLSVQEQQAVNGAEPAINNADKVLSQEQAFWQLTVKNGTVLVVRLLLSLLILGIDFAPILTKLTGRTSLHDIFEHSNHYRELEKDKHDVTTTIHRYAGQGDVDRQLHDIEMADVLFEARQNSDTARNKVQRAADVERARANASAAADMYRIDLEARLAKLEHQHRYMTRKERWSPGQWSAGGMNVPGANGSGPRDQPQPDANSANGHPKDLAVFRFQAAPVVVDDDKGQAAEAPAPPIPDDPPAAPDVPVAPDQAPAAGPSPVLDVPDDTRPIDDLADILFPPEEALVLDGRWTLIGLLPGADTGSGGTVWRARDLLGDPRTRYVVKTVPSGQVDKATAKYIKQLGVRHEQRAAGVISEHIGQVLDFGDDRGFSYLVYPLYRPGSLSAYCRWIGDRRTLGWCAEIIFQVLSGLMAASNVGLVHLDIKPGNIVLNGEQHARVIDWGLSRVWNASEPSTWIARGTPFFACPEQLIDPKTGWDTPRADLYGVAATFYWLLTGEAPLQRHARQGHDLVEYRKLLMDPRIRPEPVHQLVTGIPQPLSALIEDWLSVNPAHRVPTGTPMEDSVRVARDKLAALMPGLPAQMRVGRVTAREQRRPR